LIFTVGAAIGSAVTWKYIKTKYERIAQEEIDSVKEVFFKKKQEADEKAAYEEMARLYSDVRPEPTVERDFREEVEHMEDGPRVISPDEFGELGDEYETMSLTYYADGVLADDMDEPIDDVDDIVGTESLNHFGDYDGDEDSVFVRNDRMRCDYEILRDTRNYSEVKKLYRPRALEG
jgi:hypothetical protein